jgi:hypothetical protein
MPQSSGHQIAQGFKTQDSMNKKLLSHDKGLLILEYDAVSVRS